MTRMSQRLAPLKTARSTAEAEILFIITGAPSGEHDDSTAPAVARVGGLWFARGESETTASFADRMEDKAQEAAR